MATRVTEEVNAEIAKLAPETVSTDRVIDQLRRDPQMPPPPKAAYVAEEKEAEAEKKEAEAEEQKAEAAEREANAESRLAKAWKKTKGGIRNVGGRVKQQKIPSMPLAATVANAKPSGALIYFFFFGLLHLIDVGLIGGGPAFLRPDLGLAIDITSMGIRMGAVLYGYIGAIIFAQGLLQDKTRLKTLILLSLAIWFLPVFLKNTPLIVPLQLVPIMYVYGLFFIYRTGKIRTIAWIFLFVFWFGALYQSDIIEAAPSTLISQVNPEDQAAAREAASGALPGFFKFWRDLLSSTQRSIEAASGVGTLSQAEGPQVGIVLEETARVGARIFRVPKEFTPDLIRPSMYLVQKQDTVLPEEKKIVVKEIECLVKGSTDNVGEVITKVPFEFTGEPELIECQLTEQQARQRTIFINAIYNMQERSEYKTFFMRQSEIDQLDVEPETRLTSAELNEVKEQSTFDDGPVAIGVNNPKLYQKVIGVSDNAKLPDFILEVANRLEWNGVILRINQLGITVPSGVVFDTTEERCPFVSAGTNKYELRPEYTGYEFEIEERVLFRCPMRVGNAATLLSSSSKSLATFTTGIDFDYRTEGEVTIKVKETEFPLGDDEFEELRIAAAADDAKIREKLQAAASRFDVPYEWALGVAMQESGLVHKTTPNSAGAVGVMQITPGTVATCSNIGISTMRQIEDVDANINCGVRILKNKCDISRCLTNTPLKHPCPDVEKTYTGWQIAARYYAGNACDSVHKNYVELVEAQIAKARQQGWLP